MSLFALLSDLTSRTSRRPGSSAAARRAAAVLRRRMPRLEALEERAMMAYGFDDRGQSVALATDGSGDVIVSGGFRGWVDFDPGPGEYWLQGSSFDLNVDPYSSTESYLARYSPSRELIWAQAIPDSWCCDAGLTTYSDASGDHFYHAWYDKSDANYLIGKYSQDGAAEWQKSLPPSMNWAVDPDGGIYFVGVFNGVNRDFDPTDPPDAADTLTSNGNDVFVVKWDGDGNFSWVRQIGGPGDQGSFDVYAGNVQIAVDAGGVYVAGELTGTLVPPGASETYSDQGEQASVNSGKDAFLMLLGHDGSYSAGNTGHFVDAVSKSLALGEGAVFLHGSANAQQDIDPGPGALTVAPTGGDFFVRLASPTSSPVPAAGGWAYAHMWGGSIAYADGALYMTGKFGDFGGTFDFDPDPVDVFNMTTSGASGIYVYKVAAADGDFQWAKQLGASRLEEFGMDIVVAGDSVFSTGAFSGYDADFDPDPTQGAYFDGGGDRQAYISKLDTSGTYQWAFEIGAKMRVIDDGLLESPADADTLPDYQETAGGGGGWKQYLQGGYASFESSSQDARVHAKGNGSGTATWRFSGLVPNQPYQVNTSFRPHSKNATNAPFKVNGSAPVLINQRVAPNSFTTNFFITAKWATIGTYSADASGNIVVELIDKANGNVVADAVQVFATGPGSGGAASTSQSDLALLAVLSEDDGSALGRSRKR